MQFVQTNYTPIFKLLLKTGLKRLFNICKKLFTISNELKMLNINIEIPKHIYKKENHFHVNLQNDEQFSTTYS